MIKKLKCGVLYIVIRKLIKQLPLQFACVLRKTLTNS